MSKPIKPLDPSTVHPDVLMYVSRLNHAYDLTDRICGTDCQHPDIPGCVMCPRRLMLMQNIPEELHLLALNTPIVKDFKILDND